MKEGKPIYWMGQALGNLRAFPDKAKRHFGYQFNGIQQGESPTDFKTMPSIGSGVIELRTKTDTGAYRVVYVAKFSMGIYVLHAFQKKTQKTSLTDIATIKRQYKALKEALK